MKFTSKTLFLIFASLAVCLGWWVDRTRLSAQLDKKSEEIVSAAEGGMWWGLAEHSRQYSIEIKGAPEALTTYNRRKLTTMIFWLFRFETKVDQGADLVGGQSSTRITRELLDELECTSHEQFMGHFAERFEDQFTEFCDENTEEYLSLEQFISKSLE